MHVPIRRIIRYGFSLLLVVAAFALLINRQYVLDWWRVKNYNPPAAIVQLADQGTVTDRARFIFYAADPQVENSVNFNAHCQKKSEKTIVLGCYNGRQIYVFDVADKQLSGVKQVTAMHELLHAAYDRLSSSERAKVDEWVQAEFKALNDSYINDLVMQYQKTEPTEINNELHSILGTEVTKLSPNLEAYYAKYFTNRQAVVSFAAQYKAVFQESEAQIAALDKQLATLKQRIDNNEANLATEQTAINAEATRMNTLKKRGDVTGYNNAVDPYNRKVAVFNDLVDATKKLVEEYNAVVGRRNKLATAHANLADSLNSNLNTLPKQ